MYETEFSSVHEHKSRKWDKPITFGLLIISDSRWQAISRGEQVKNDKTSEVVEKLITKNNQFIFRHFGYLPDDASLIKQKIKELIQEEHIDVIITSGGTGISKRDVTVESIRPLFEKELTGFTVAFQYLSFLQVGSASILSRATAGIANDKIIFVLPGSPNAVSMALDKVILPEIVHILTQVRGKS